MPHYTLDKIKFATDRGTFERAVGLYSAGAVLQCKKNEYGYHARVKGSGRNVYEVYVGSRRYDEGSCNGYLGKEDVLCKHMVAVALYAVMGGKPLADEDTAYTSAPKASGKAGELSKDELAHVKAEISAALRYIKAYNGPSRTWFTYQNSLMEGSNRLAALVSALPVSHQTAVLLVDLLLRLDKKLCTGGVDDSDGTVGGCMEGIVSVLEEYATQDPACVAAFEKLKGIDTCFGWEEPLVARVKKSGV